MHPCRVYKGIRYCYRRNATPFSLLTNLLPPPSATNYFPFLYINHAHAFQSPFSINSLQEVGLCIMWSENFMQNISFSKNKLYLISKLKKIYLCISQPIIAINNLQNLFCFPCNLWNNSWLIILIKNF